MVEESTADVDISTVSGITRTEGSDPNTTAPGTELPANSPVLVPVTFAVTIVGLFANALTVAVMLHKDSRKMPVSRLLLVLALSDVVCLLADLDNIKDIVLLLGAELPTSLSPWACNIVFWWRRVGGLVSHWLLVAVSVDRFIAVFFYTQAKSISTVRNMNLVIVSITVFVVYHVSCLTALRNFDQCPSTSTASHRFVVILSYVTAVLYVIIPIPVLVLVNTATALRLCVRRGGDQKHRNLTIMLLCVTGLFVVLTLPFFVIRVSSLPPYHLANELAKLFITLDHSCNFFVYVVVGKRFRRNMREMLGRLNGKCPSGQTSG